MHFSRKYRDLANADQMIKEIMKYIFWPRLRRCIRNAGGEGGGGRLKIRRRRSERERGDKPNRDGRKNTRGDSIAVE